MEVHYYQCDVCGCEIDIGRRIRATKQTIRRSPEHRFSIDICEECWNRICKEAKKESEVERG